MSQSLLNNPMFQNRRFFPTNPDKTPKKSYVEKLLEKERGVFCQTNLPNALYY